MIITKDNGTKHQLINADCLSLDLNDIMGKIVFDLVLTDLPYGTTKCKWDQVIDLEKMWKWLPLFTYEDTPILLFAQTPFDKVLGSSNIRNLKYEWIWEKTSATGHLNAKKMPMKCHENILVFYKKLPLYNPQKTSGHVRKTAYKGEHLQSDVYNKTKNNTYYDSTDRYPRDVLKFASDKQKLNIHSTQKPLELLRYMIRTYTNEGILCWISPQVVCLLLRQLTLKGAIQCALRWIQNSITKVLSGLRIVVLIIRIRWTTNDKIHLRRTRSFHQHNQNKCCKEV